ncbi:hypothetical protein F5879DRAFT_939998 [Lentinula edodes]|uniref:Vacuolar membrane protein n=1 Tax=Lentinula edodes TaxID=5353 RepID=A0A1Q3EQ24_LENED|nr:uncharacterized protein C8R40DRAFT_253787 [Lentinula edodes]KAH7880446.1 hypothetical protein C8R40DRAFT_253787 [Lentinula edodes]KAJ3907854.1 hypothetical protein F5879DRAFT_939998 [Lentinula edodes]GAW09292.1 vacuolar membrane protein [Lentinula edodes]
MATIAVARAYQASFQSRPHTTLAVTGGTFNALGDFVAQTYQNTYGKQEHTGPFRYDLDRTLRFFCFGFAISPLIGRWNVFLERHFPLRASSGSGSVSLKALFKRVAADQIVMAPIGLSLFLGSMGVMERRTMPQIKQKFFDLYTPALITNWQVWPIAQLINFRFMPLPYRVPFQSTCGVFWTLYLSIINSKEDMKQDREVELHKTLIQ